MAMKNEWSEARRSTYILYMHLQYVRGLEAVALLFVIARNPWLSVTVSVLSLMIGVTEGIALYEGFRLP